LPHRNTVSAAPRNRGGILFLARSLCAVTPIPKKIAFAKSLRLVFLVARLRG